MATRPDGAPARGLSQERLVERIRQIHAGMRPGTPPLEAESFRGQWALRVPAEDAQALLRLVRDDAELAFEMLTDVTCVHWPRRPLPLGPFDVVYHLTSLTLGHRIRLKVACPDPDVGVDSAVPVWPGANLMEREAFDMFGVRFNGHPDLRRVLMGSDYEGWPLRKDFPYRGH